MSQKVPDEKLVFKAVDVCRAAGIQTYVLRYWESEFPQLSGGKPPGPGARTYSREELELVVRLKTLLYDEGYTIAGARKKLEAEAGATQRDSEEETPVAEGKRPPVVPRAEPPIRRAPKGARKGSDPASVSIDSPVSSGLNAGSKELVEIAESLEEVARNLSEPL